jgi:hypothetical protein
MLVRWNNWPGQRKMDLKKVEEYRRKMANKLWFKSSVSVARQTDEKHKPVLARMACRITLSSMASTRSKLSPRWRKSPESANRSVLRSTWNQIEILFSQFDVHKARRPSDVLGPVTKLFGMATQTKRGVPVERLL